MATKINKEPVNVQVPEEIEKPVDIFRQATMDIQNAQLRKKKVHATYMNEERVPMYLSPTYQNEFGNVMPVTINGIAIFFKVDGSTQLVPRTYADEITRRRLCIDSKINRQRQMSNISDNYETSAGEIKLF